MDDEQKFFISTIGIVAVLTLGKPYYVKGFSAILPIIVMAGLGSLVLTLYFKRSQ